MTAQELKQRYAAGERGFQGANLSGADLSGENLSGADFSGADLSGASFRRSYLRGVRFYQLNLYGADFFGADLSKASLFGANLCSAKNIHVYGAAPTSGRMVYFIRHEFGWMVKAGCFWGSLDQLEKAVMKSHECPWYLGLIQLHRGL